MEAKEVSTELNSTSAELLDTISGFSQEEINIVPFAGSWTAGQVAEHVLKSVQGVLRNTTATVKPTERDPAEHVEPLKNIFLNFTIKMNSPDFIIPSEEPKNKEELMNSLRSAFGGINQVVLTKNLDETCTSFAMPGLGELTRLEWIRFTAFHTQRHIHQLQNIHEKLKA